MEELKSIPILSQMTDEQHASYSARCSWRVYEAGEMILDHEETSNDVRFIAAGFVRIVARVAEGREVIFNDFDAGRFFGELSAIDNGIRSANVTALTRARICIMPQSVFA